MIIFILVFSPWRMRNVYLCLFHGVLCSQSEHKNIVDHAPSRLVGGGIDLWEEAHESGAEPETLLPDNF